MMLRTRSNPWLASAWAALAVGVAACGGGDGTGATACTAFRVRKNHITDWLRLPDVEPTPGSPS